MVSRRCLEHPFNVAHLGDVIQAACFRDEIELDPGWRRCGFQHLEKPRKSLRTNPLGASRPRLPTPPRSARWTPRYPRSTRDTRGSPARCGWARPATARREQPDWRRTREPPAQQRGAPRTGQEHLTYQGTTGRSNTAMLLCSLEFSSIDECAPTATSGDIPQNRRGRPECWSLSDAGAGVPVSPCASPESWL